MRSFDEIYAIAAERKGGDAALEALLSKPASDKALLAKGDDRWLSTMAKCVFQAGFNWKVIEAKWPGFEEAFEGFDPARVARYSDVDLDRLLADKRIVRNGAKVASVIDNARLLTDLAAEHGSAGAFFVNWPSSDLVGLLREMNKRGSRLGGITGARVLRWMGRDSFIVTPDVVKRLIAEGVVTKNPTSQRDMKDVQAAFDRWVGESGRSYTEVSQVLAMS